MLGKSCSALQGEETHLCRPRLYSRRSKTCPSTSLTHPLRRGCSGCSVSAPTLSLLAPPSLPLNPGQEGPLSIWRTSQSGHLFAKGHDAPWEITLILQTPSSSSCHYCLKTLCLILSRPHEHIKSVLFYKRSKFLDKEGVVYI